MKKQDDSAALLAILCHNNPAAVAELKRIRRAEKKWERLCSGNPDNPTWGRMKERMLRRVEAKHSGGTRRKKRSRFGG